MFFLFVFFFFTSPEGRVEVETSATEANKENEEDRDNGIQIPTIIITPPEEAIEMVTPAARDAADAAHVPIAMMEELKKLKEQIKYYEAQKKTKDNKIEEQGKKIALLQKKLRLPLKSSGLGKKVENQECDFEGNKNNNNNNDNNNNNSYLVEYLELENQTQLLTEQLRQSQYLILSSQKDILSMKQRMSQLAAQNRLLLSHVKKWTNISLQQGETIDAQSKIITDLRNHNQYAMEQARALAATHEQLVAQQAEGYINKLKSEMELAAKDFVSNVERGVAAERFEVESRFAAMNTEISSLKKKIQDRDICILNIHRTNPAGHRAGSTQLMPPPPPPSASRGTSFGAKRRR